VGQATLRHVATSAATSLDGQEVPGSNPGAPMEVGGREVGEVFGLTPQVAVCGSALQDRSG
jgi:hypothetical protein